MSQNIESELQFFSKELEEPVYDEKVTQRVIKLADMPVGSLILDAGCGAGYWSRKFSINGCDTIGVDISEDLIEAARKQALPGQTFQVCDLNKELPFDKKFDGIFCGCVLHHLPEIKDVDLIIQNLTGCLKPGGKLIIIEPNGSNPIVRMSRFVGRLLVRILSVKIATENETMHSTKTYLRLMNASNLKTIEVESMKDIESMDPDSSSETENQNALIGFFVGIRRLLLSFFWKLLPDPYRGSAIMIVTVLED